MTQKRMLNQIKKDDDMNMIYDEDWNSGLYLWSKFLEQWEGGWSNHKKDRGGPTMKGVTLATYQHYCKLKGVKKAVTADDLKAISNEEWLDIVKSLYWDKWQADMIINRPVAIMLADWYWCSGKYGITIPQKLLGVRADGVVGPETIKAVNAKAGKAFFEMLQEARLDFVYSIVDHRPDQRVFIKGWVKRILATNYNNWR